MPHQALIVYYRLAMMNSFKKCILILVAISTLACQPDHQTVEDPEESRANTESTLLNHTVFSEGHPMRVWEKRPDQVKGAILFIHGRTWSSLPNFDLQVEGEDLSLMDAMAQEGYAAYALDLRGYGGTTRDSSEWLSPHKAAKDILNVLNWISTENDQAKVHLFGYSMGSTSSLLAAQTDPSKIASLTVFGYWQDLDVKIPEASGDPELKKLVNTGEAAASDFITPGSISQTAIDAYVRMALENDPIKVDWKDTHQFNDIDPTMITPRYWSCRGN
jgi:alpha-beta hydrolase superfamily lysophospholipase